MLYNFWLSQLVQERHYDEYFDLFQSIDGINKYQEKSRNTKQFRDYLYYTKKSIL